MSLFFHFNNSTEGGVQTIDIMLIAGQSNALGTTESPDTVASPSVANGSVNYHVATEVLQDPLADPTSNNTVGQSMLPALANEWYRLTGRAICGVNGAIGGSYLLAAGGPPNWSSSGTLRSDFYAWANEAKAEIEALPDDYILGDVYVIWVQGEAEIIGDNGTTITPTLYEADLESLADAFYTQFNGVFGSAYKGMWLAFPPIRYEDSTEPANQLVALTESGYAYCRAMKNAADDNANLNMAYEGPISYQSVGYASDNVHHDSRGQQEQGVCIAQRMAGVSSLPATPSSPYIASTLYTDTSESTKSSKTYSHTTSAGTDCLAVAVSAALVTGTSGDVYVYATFGGVEMARAGGAFTESVGQSAAAVLYINEEMYGSSLDGVTGDIVITTRPANPASTKTVNQIHATAIDATGVYRVDVIAGDNDITSATTASEPIKPFVGSMIINCTTAIFDNAGTSSATVTGLTEIQDLGLHNSVWAKTIQHSVSYGTLAADTELTPSIVFADSMQEIASINVALRPKIEGESVR